MSFVRKSIGRDDAFTNNSGDIFLVVEVERSPQAFKKTI